MLNPLAGLPLRYLIGRDDDDGIDGTVTVVGYDATRVPRRGISIAYCNLFDEHNTGKYGPYLRTSDTATQYNESQIDPRGPGWEKNLREQFERRAARRASTSSAIPELRRAIPAAPTISRPF